MGEASGDSQVAREKRKWTHRKRPELQEKLDETREAERLGTRAQKRKVGRPKVPLLEMKCKNGRRGEPKPGKKWGAVRRKEAKVRAALFEAATVMYSGAVEEDVSEEAFNRFLATSLEMNAPLEVAREVMCQVHNGKLKKLLEDETTAKVSACFGEDALAAIATR